MKPDEARPAEVGLRTLVVACVRADAGGDLIGPLDEERRWVAEALQRRMGFRLRTGPGPAHEHGKTYGAGATGEVEAGLVGVRDVGLVLVHRSGSGARVSQHHELEQKGD